MGYIEQSLMPGEEVVYKTRLHWGSMLWAWLDLVITLGITAVVGVVLYIVFITVPEHWGWLVLAAALFLLIVVTAFARAAGAAVSFLTTEFGVTNKRVLVKMGLLRRQSLEILLTHVEGVSADQDFFGRIFGYGTIVITGSGGTKQLFKAVSAPFELRKKVVEQIEALEKPAAKKR